nr:MAG TPA: hypothetical protein [Caudoviricetes sp.]
MGNLLNALRGLAPNGRGLFHLFATPIPAICRTHDAAHD